MLTTPPLRPHLSRESHNSTTWTERLKPRDTEGMVKSVEGIYRNGKVELAEPLPDA